jgi:hypothetical protein
MCAHHRREEAKQWKCVIVSLTSRERAKGEEVVTNISYATFALCYGISGTAKRENTRSAGRGASKPLRFNLVDERGIHTANSMLHKSLSLRAGATLCI